MQTADAFCLLNNIDAKIEHKKKMSIASRIAASKSSKNKIRCISLDLYHVQKKISQNYKTLVN